MSTADSTQNKFNSNFVNNTEKTVSFSRNFGFRNIITAFKPIKYAFFSISVLGFDPVNYGFSKQKKLFNTVIPHFFEK